MQVFTKSEMITSKIDKVDTAGIKCFTETPRKTGQEKPLSRIGAFDLFTLFTAEIIRRNQVFIR